ncbi:MAG: hypothetical protein A2189_07370, partial [Paenibacillus sp. RIFOXYA1_FULL_44_5]
SLNAAFTGGTGVLNQSSHISLTDTQTDPVSSSNLNNPNPNSNTIPNTNPNSTASQTVQQETAELSQLKQKMDQYIKDNQLTTQLETKLTDSYLLIRIRDHALFDSGSANLKTESQQLAMAVSQLLAQYPKYRIQIAGYTDNVPIQTAEFPSNWDLSTKRALNFMKILLQDSNMDPARFSAVGYGEYHPIAVNTTEEGRSQNRRVEIYVYRTVTTANSQLSPGK